MKIGVFGASGFIGHRIVEVLQDKAEIRPIARSRSSLAHWSHLDCRSADALDRASLQKAFAGCDVIVHSVNGNPGMIRGTIAESYRAAEKAGVRRLIYLSSMCVYGQAPAIGTTEETVFRKPQPFPYNSAKIDSEQSLMRLRQNGDVETVIFRPGIVFGARSPRVAEIVNELLSRTAYLVNGGSGICNTTYVDNLVYAIGLATTVAEADRQAFFVGEHETVTWREFYEIFAQAFGIPFDVPEVAPVSQPQPGLKQRLIEPIRDSVFVQKLLTLLRAKLKRSTSSRSQSGVPLALPERVVTYEMSLLHRSPYKLPYHKAQQILGYEPIVSLPQACQATIDWLAEEGYPVAKRLLGERV